MTYMYIFWCGEFVLLRVSYSIDGLLDIYFFWYHYCGIVVLLITSHHSHCCIHCCIATLAHYYQTTRQLIERVRK